MKGWDYSSCSLETVLNEEMYLLLDYMLSYTHHMNRKTSELTESQISDKTSAQTEGQQLNQLGDLYIPTMRSTRWHLGGRSTWLSLFPHAATPLSKEQKPRQGENERKHKACRRKTERETQSRGGTRKSQRVWEEKRRRRESAERDNVAGGFLWCRVWVHLRMRPNSH